MNIPIVSKMDISTRRSITMLILLALGAAWLPWVGSYVNDVLKIELFGMFTVGTILGIFAVIAAWMMWQRKGL